MKRLKDLDLFYAMLDILQKKHGIYYLKDDHSPNDWPKRGVYFFFEQGENRDSGTKLRVIRVGTHAVTDKARTTLWGRLRQHRGNIGGFFPDGGNHRGSIFRLHIGAAVIRRDGLHCDTWFSKDASKEVRDKEYEVEKKVSSIIRAMPFLCLKADDPPGPQSIRKYIERNSIGLLSNYNRDPIDRPSDLWLGQYSDSDCIRESGLWNIDHVNEDYDPVFLKAFSNLIGKM